MKPNYLNEVDGWYEIADHPQQHFFFKEHSLCGMYATIPETAHHDNVPLKHCNTCTNILRKLISVSSMIAGKKLNAGQVMRLIDALEHIKLNKGFAENQKYLVLSHFNFVSWSIYLQLPDCTHDRGKYSSRTTDRWYI